MLYDQRALRYLNVAFSAVTDCSAFEALPDLSTLIVEGTKLSPESQRAMPLSHFRKLSELQCQRSSTAKDLFGCFLSAALTHLDLSFVSAIPSHRLCVQLGLLADLYEKERSVREAAAAALNPPPLPLLASSPPLTYSSPAGAEGAPSPLHLSPRVGAAMDTKHSTPTGSKPQSPLMQANNSPVLHSSAGMMEQLLLAEDKQFRAILHAGTGPASAAPDVGLRVLRLEGCSLNDAVMQVVARLTTVCSTFVLLL